MERNARRYFLLGTCATFSEFIQEMLLPFARNLDLLHSCFAKKGKDKYGEINCMGTAAGAVVRAFTRLTLGNSA